MMKYILSVLNYLLLFRALNIVFSQTTQIPEDDDVNIPEVCQFLVDTDKYLVEKYKASPKGEGEEIMTTVRKYNDALSSVVQKLMKENHMNVTSSISEAQLLIDHGGPEFINFYVERPILEERFGLNNVSSRLLCCQRQNTIDIWQDFYKLYSKISDDDDE